MMLLLIGIFIIPSNTFSQFTLKETDEQKEKKEEERYLNFQKHFFEAIQLKAREEYTKAIESLDNCKAIYPDNAGLNFEYGKNYLFLKDFDNAIFFDKKALEKKPTNIHILEHIVKAYRLLRDYENAIEFQKEVVALKPSKENDLIFLYILNKEKDLAKSSFLKIEKLGLLDHRKKYYNRVLFPKKEIVPKKTTNENIKKENTIISDNSLESLKNKFKKDKSYKSLMKLLVEEKKLIKTEELINDSEEGLTLFPAQPTLYFINGEALNSLKKYKKALSSLTLGLDFIIDDNDLLLNYYEQIKVAYLGLGQQKNATKYLNKALSLKKQLN